MRSWRILTLLPFLITVPALAQSWFETGDAGSLPSIAQAVGTPGPIDVILGNLDSLTDVDMYLFMIVDPLNFSARTIETGFSITDPQLFLFNASGLGVYMNDDGNGVAPQSFLEAGDPLGPLSAGIHYLAIGWWNNEPASFLGLVFEQGVGTNGPDPIGGAAPVFAWNDDVTGRIDLPTLYQIELTGVVGIPEPATLWLVGLALALPAWRRYRPPGGEATRRTSNRTAAL